MMFCNVESEIYEDVGVISAELLFCKQGRTMALDGCDWCEVNKGMLHTSAREETVG